MRVRFFLWTIGAFGLGVIAAHTAQAQSLVAPVEAHVAGDVLSTDSNAYLVTWGHNCDAIPQSGEVLMWAVDGVPDQVAMAPVTEDGTVSTVVATGDDTVQSQMCSALLAPEGAITGPIAQGEQ